MDDLIVKVFSLLVGRLTQIMPQRLHVQKTQAIAGIREQVALQERGNNKLQNCTLLVDEGAYLSRVEYTALLSEPTNQDAQKLLQDLDEDVRKGCKQLFDC